MTRDEIMNMPAGREMDALIAEHVMGLYVYDGERKIVRYEGFFGQHKRTYTVPEIYVRIPNVANVSCNSYSTDIKYAWEIVEKFPIFYAETNHELKEYFAMVGNNFDTSVTAETMPLAICRAALLATMEHQ